MDHHEEALIEALEALKLAKIDEVERALIRSYALIAHEHLCLGQIEFAESFLDESEELIEERGISSMPFGNGLYFIVLGELHIVKGAIEVGNQEVSRGFDILMKTRIAPIYQAIGHFWYGSILNKMGDYVHGMEEINISKDLFEFLDNKTQINIINEKYLR